MRGIEPEQLAHELQVAWPRRRSMGGVLQAALLRKAAQADRRLVQQAPENRARNRLDAHQVAL